ncbi:MAG: RCC1 domain-containing protein, partial [Limisphaerales bacterium]
GYGQLGDGTYSITNKPERIISSDVIEAAAGGNHTLFLKSNGSLWAMGSNRYGQLGNGTYVTTNAPTQIVPDNVAAVAAGLDHSLFLKTDGSLWAMGRNDQGQLGDGNNSFADFVATNKPEQIISTRVIALSAGFSHSLFLKADGSLWGMGENFYGQLGPFNSRITSPQKIVDNGIVAIAAGDFHSLFLKSDGSLWAMGDNEFGQLGGGTSDRTNNPIQIVPSGVVALAAGGFHSLFLKSDGSLWEMGWNNNGQLGNGFNSSSSSPEQIFPLPQPMLKISILSQTELQFKGTCLFGGTYYLLTSTNLIQPLSLWSPVLTNSITTRSNDNFNATITNALNSNAEGRFYIIRSQ